MYKITFKSDKVINSTKLIPLHIRLQVAFEAVLQEFLYDKDQAKNVNKYSSDLINETLQIFREWKEDGESKPTEYLCDSLIHNIFGSASSTDYDIMVCVPKIPDTIEECHEIIDCLNSMFLVKYTDKVINCNICEVNNGIITNVFKGTSDECNNSIWHTHKLHNQPQSCFVTRTIPRDIDLKILRVFRFFCTIFSRNKLRKEIKSALRGNLKEKIEILLKIDYCDTALYGSKNLIITDALKTIAFQLGQIRGLLENIELYTKEDVILHYPKYEPFINRIENSNADILYLDLKFLCDIVTEQYSHLLHMNETDYNQR